MVLVWRLRKSFLPRSGRASVPVTPQRAHNGVWHHGILWIQAGRRFAHELGDPNWVQTSRPGLPGGARRLFWDSVMLPEGAARVVGGPGTGNNARRTINT